MDLKEDLLWKETFFKNDFSVDQCLSRYTQKSDLEILRRDLKNYGNDLQSQMTEILKTETEAIVNLAEYLTSLNSKIDNLSVPVSQLREEIRTLYDLIANAEFNYRRMLEDIKDNSSKRNHIHLKLGIISASFYISNSIHTVEDDLPNGLLTLEKMVNKYSFQKNYMDELKLTSSDTELATKNVEKRLVEEINKKFLFAFKNRDKETILRCLRMYDNLKKEDEVQESLRVNIVRPALQPLFTESYLEKCNYNVEKIYDDVLQFLENDLEILSQILRENPELHCFNFVLNSFWKELDKQSREGLPHITAPGNPELFQKRFTATWKLLKQIAEKSGSESLVRDENTFQEHLKRFNLPVYFEIKFQQIAGDFESEIFNFSLGNVAVSNNKLFFKLKPSILLWESVEKCFHQDVYIDHLADQFIRLSMMLLSRCLKWFENMLQNEPSSSQDGKYEDFIINSIIDMDILENKLSPNCDSYEDIEKTVFSIMNKTMRPVICKVFVANRKKITSVKRSLQNHLVDIKSAESIKHLQNVGSIPRLYRRTNRSPPKEASTYMVQAVKPIVLFQNKFKTIIKEQLEEILDVIITRITRQYLTLVQEVLMSVCKTEESLRRLKSRTLNTNEDAGQSQSDTMSDEKKIREQIKYDVGYFLDKLYPLGGTGARQEMDILKRETC